MLEVLSMLLEAGQHGCPVKIILEKFDLPCIRQIVTSWVESVQVHVWQGNVVQILVQTLLRCQLTTTWEVIVELIGAQQLVNVLIAI